MLYKLHAVFGLQLTHRPAPKKALTVYRKKSGVAVPQSCSLANTLFVAALAAFNRGASFLWSAIYQVPICLKLPALAPNIHDNIPPQFVERQRHPFLRVKKAPSLGLLSPAASTCSCSRIELRMKIRRAPHARTPGGLCLVLAWASAVCASVQPFRPVETAVPVAKRQQSCLANFFSCADQGAVFAGVCCQNGQRCALDASNNPACCPSK
jgi:hypothetical protein